MSAIWFYSKSMPPFHMFRVNLALPEFDEQFPAVFNKCGARGIK